MTTIHIKATNDTHLAHTLRDNSEINTLFNPQENHSLEEFGFDYVNSFSTSFCSPQDLLFCDYIGVKPCCKNKICFVSKCGVLDKYGLDYLRWKV